MSCNNEGQRSFCWMRLRPGSPTALNNLPLLVGALLIIMSSCSALRITIAVGSKNPVKVNAAENGIRRALLTQAGDDGPRIEIDTHTYDVPSGVSDQPSSDAETKLGAVNRARACFAAHQLASSQAPTYAVGLEGGIVDAEGEMTCCAWMAVYDGTRLGTARTCTFQLPPRIAELVRGGLELGAADDVVFGSVNSKQKGGTVGHLTRGGIDRTSYYVPAVELAMIPLLWTDLY